MKKLHIFYDLDATLVVSILDNHFIVQIICPDNLIWPFVVGCEMLGSKVCLGLNSNSGFYMSVI